MSATAPLPPAHSRTPATARAALAAFLVCVLGLLAYRTYSPRLSARATEDVTPSARAVDLNTADRVELMQLPGVGPNLADAILTHRTERGRFDAVDDLTAVHGVGPKTLDKLRPHLTVSDTLEKLERKPRAEPPVAPTRGNKVQAGEAKIDVNAAGEAELQRLPKVGPVLAAAIVAARTEKKFASVDDLRRVRGIGVKTLDGLRPFVTAGPAE